MLNNHKVGLALGSFVSLLHAVWAILVALGVAQSLMDFVFYLHMVVNPYMISDFNFGLAVGLVVYTAIMGYVVGWVFAALYNWAQK